MSACARLWLCVALALLAGGGGVRADDENGEISVVRMRLSFDTLHVLAVNSTTEYMLEFVPDTEQALFPARLWARTDGGDHARPMLITARHTTGAQTWQLPYSADGGSAGDGEPQQLLYELERTLCTANGDGTEHCGDEGEWGNGVVRGQFSVHVGAVCGARRLELRAAPHRAWLLPFDRPVDLHATQAAAAVHRYVFAAEQESVRLVAAAEDDVCATLSVHNYTCPLPETLAEVGLGGLRMTMQRSGAVQIARSSFPLGFVVVLSVHARDSQCAGEQAPDDEWLWEAVLGVGEQARPAAQPPRDKHAMLTVQAALSRAQYAAATAGTAALFLLFYAACGALVLAQRAPACRRLVAPRAVLADTDTHTEADAAGAGRDAEAPAARAEARARRRGSTATYDSSDNSDTESDEESVSGAAPGARQANDTAQAAGAGAGARAVSYADAHAPGAGGAADAAEDGGGAVVADASAPGAAAAPTPFGLPASLRVSALSRRGAHTLRARADRYLHTLYTVAVFYALPVVQFVAAFQMILNVSGSLDLCYYNWLCAHPAGALTDFNHVFSNAGYLLLGALFMLQVRRRRARRRRTPRHAAYGIPAHYGLLSALGAAMMVVALLSASYHVCPNGLNFQFDTAFMYVLAVLIMVKIYQSRHPDVNARAHATFGVLAALIALVVWGVLGGGALFWGAFTVLHVFAALLLSLRIYYVGQFRLDKHSVSEAARGGAGGARGAGGAGGAWRPLYSARLALIAIANAANWAFALYGLVTMPADFAGHLLSVLLCNALLHMVFYLCMKLLHGERLRWYAWLYLGAAAAAWAPALYYFTYGSSDWAASPAHSRHSNHECKVLQFYDAHDLWHMLSAVALYLSFNALLTWDDGLSAVSRKDIAVF